MRILIGTLHCGENEFNECVRSLKMQTHQDWDHFVIADKPNKQAHEMLYATFMDRADEFDLFLKLDADMVLEDTSILDRIERYLAEHRQLDAITIRVADFFSDQLIHGLHVYRSSTCWPRTAEQLFVDAFPVAAQRLRIGVVELEPAASHCKKSTPFFAFHYGVHRGIKARQAIDNGSFRSAASYLETIEFVSENFVRTEDLRIGFALLGAELALDGNYDVKDLDLTGLSLRQAFSEFETLSLAGLKEIVLAVRSRPPNRIVNRRRQIFKRRLVEKAFAYRDSVWPSIVKFISPRIRRVRRPDTNQIHEADD